MFLIDMPHMALVLCTTLQLPFCTTCLISGGTLQSQSGKALFSCSLKT